jgi:HlyD family secretion protein
MASGALRKALVAVVAVAACGALWTSLETALPVEVVEVTRGPVREVVEEEGEARVVDRFVVSMPVGGRLLRLTLDEGDRVEQGQVLAGVDPLPLRAKVDATRARIRSLQAQLAGVDKKRPKEQELKRANVLVQSASEAVGVAERELESAKAEEAEARRDLEQTQTLLASGSVTQDEVEAAQLEVTRTTARVGAYELKQHQRELEVEAAQLRVRILEETAHDVDWEEESLREQVRALEAELEALTDDLQRTDLVAPVAGVVLRRFHESEIVLQEGAPVLEIGDPTQLEVEVDFLSADAARMRAGMPAELFGGALGQRVLTGRVDRVHPSAFKKVSSLGVEQQRVFVVIAFDGAEGLGDAYRVDVRVILDQRESALLVPESALFRSGGPWHAFRVGDGRARRVEVATGLSDGRAREALSGLEAGDRVVVHPPDDVEDGTAVRPLP